MRIGIDCRFWSRTGIGRYERNIVNMLAKLDDKNDYVLFVMDEDYDSIILPKNFSKVRANVPWFTFAEQLKMPIYYYKAKLDLLFVPNFNVPILYFKKFVATVHDLTVLRAKTGKTSTHFYPIYLLKWAASNFPFRFVVWRAKAIFVVSNFVLEDVVKTLGAARSKMYLSMCAVSPKFKRVYENDMQKVLLGYNIQRPYIFYVGNAQTHKNVDRLIQAFEIISKQRPDLTLVLGGKTDFFYEKLENKWKKSEVYKKIKFIGFVKENTLPALYTGAKAYVNPSLHEGFGIQLLEAFACGTRVASSNVTSLPKIVLVDSSHENSFTLS